jgi:hypothetical protein
MELGEMWKSWQCKLNVEEVKWQIAKNPINDTTFRATGSIDKDRPPDSVPIAVCSLVKSVFGPVRVGGRYGSETRRIGDDS